MGRRKLEIEVAPLPSYVGTYDTPVWMLYRSESGQYESVLVAWYNCNQHKEEDFLTLRTFGTKEEADRYLYDFWDSFWRLM